MINVDEATKEQLDELESWNLQGNGLNFCNLFEQLISIVMDSA